MTFAQLLGGAGYATLIVATQMRRRRAFLIVDAAGMVPVITHYLLLEAFAGAAMSGLYLLADVVGVLKIRSSDWVRVAMVWFVLGTVLIVINWSGPIDLLAAAGTAAAILARHCMLMRPRLIWIIVSCLGWAGYGLAVDSIAQIIFSLAYALACGVGLLMLGFDSGRKGAGGESKRGVRNRFYKKFRRNCYGDSNDS